jgi:hypothetical protein
MSKARDDYYANYVDMYNIAPNPMKKASLYIKELESKETELIDVIQKIKSLTKSKAVNNPLDQIYVISDITLQKYEVK